MVALLFKQRIASRVSCATLDASEGVGYLLFLALCCSPLSRNWNGKELACFLFLRSAHFRPSAVVFCFGFSSFSFHLKTMVKVLLVHVGCGVLSHSFHQLCGSEPLGIVNTYGTPSRNCKRCNFNSLYLGSMIILEITWCISCQIVVVIRLLL